VGRAHNVGDAEGVAYMSNSDVDACTGLGLTGIPWLWFAFAFIHSGKPAVLMDLKS